MACEPNLMIRESDGYINATALAKSCCKKMAHYRANDSTKYFLGKLSARLRIPVSDLVISTQARGANSGTWVHPQVVTHFAAWVSADFAACVSGWIEQAKASLPAVKAEYDAQLERLEADDGIDQVELRVRDALALRLGGDVEVVCNHGRIDVVTPLEVIEVKHAPKYLHALGQVLGYSEAFPDRARRIHLFGTASEVTEELLRKVTSLVAKFDIVVTHEIL